jgi:transketolase
MGKISTRQAYGQTLAALAPTHPDIVVLDADLSKSTKTYDFYKAAPERFFNVGVAEQNLAGISAGLAACGKTVFMSTFAVFAAGRALEQVRNSICHARMNVKIAATHAGLTVGEDGGTHQSVADIAMMRSLPHMTVLVPSDANQTKKVVESAIQIKGPVYIRLGRMDVDNISDPEGTFAIGKADTLRAGGDVTLIACGLMVQEALKAAEILAVEGLEARVLNMASVKPADQEAIVKAARETGAIVTAEEHSIVGGLGSAVAEVLAERACAPMTRVGIRDVFGESGKPMALLEKYGLTAGDIVAAAKGVIHKKRG